MATARNLLPFSQYPAFHPKKRQSAEVIVIGGGLSGLQAAYDAQKAGLTCLVLEAGVEVGGQLRHGTNVNGTWVDLVQHTRTVNLIKELGIELVFQEGQKDDLSKLDAHDIRSLSRVRNNLQRLCERVDVNKPADLLPNYGSMNVHELVSSHGATPTVRSFANSWTSSFFGMSSQQVDALSFLLHCKAAGGFEQLLFTERNLRLQQELCEKLAARLQPGTVLLSERVDTIDQRSASTCMLSTQTGAIFYCSKVILAVPLSYHRYISFSPSLSEDKQWLHTCVVTHKGVKGEPVPCLSIPATSLRSLEQDQWEPELNVHFAGSETSHVWKAHVEGALSSGSRAVEEVLKTLRSSSDALCSKL